MPRHRGEEDGRPGDQGLPATSTGAGRGCPAKLTIAVVDDRPVALVFPASRRVVLDRLRKLLGADEVRLAPREEIVRILDDHPDGAGRPPTAPPGVPLIVDASLLSVWSLCIESYQEEGPVKLPLEDWLTTARPRLGFFTEPARGPH